MRLPRLLKNALTCHTAALVLLGGVGLLAGCDVPSFIDPGETAGLRAHARDPLVVQILDEIDPAAEQENRQFATAQPPKAEDFVTDPADYVVGANDLLEVTVFNLEGPGLQTIKRVRVSGTGNLTLPFLQNVVRAEGLTEGELQQAISEAYRQAGVLDQADVSVSVVEQRNRAYTVTGLVARPGQYVITDEDFRLLDALTTAGDVQSPFIEDAYIVRSLEGPPKHTGNQGMAPAPAGARPTTRPAAGGRGSTRPALKDDLAPQSRALGKMSLSQSVLLQVQGAQPAAAVEAAAADEDSSARVGRIDGQEVVVQPGADTGANATSEPSASMDDNGKPFEFNDMPALNNIRVIKIPLSKLRAGDLQYNVAIRPRDRIIIPSGQVGFYYMDGHVANKGAYAFNGQKVTLMNAIASANGLDGLAIPQRTDIVRRIGSNQQMFFRVDVAKIFAGKSPDLYLKPNDHVMVGTNFLAPFLAAVRGGFRMTYGLGFLYDRNYAYDDNNQNR